MNRPSASTASAGSTREWITVESWALDASAVATARAARSPALIWARSAPSARRPSGVGLFGHQEDERARLARHQRQRDGQFGAGGELGHDRVGRGHHGHVGAGDQPGEAGVPAGRFEPVPVEAPPAHNLHATRPGREAGEPGPGPETAGAQFQGGGHQPVYR